MPLALLSVRSDLAKLSAKLGTLSKKQLPFAYSQTINRLARQAVDDLQAKEQSVFDRPTPWTLRGFYARLGNKAHPTADVMAKDFAGKGTPAWKYLEPETFGGSRRMKRFERALKAKFGTDFTVPGRGMALNQYGNISQGDINKLLSALAAFPENGYLANRSKRGGKRGRKKATYFLAHSHEDGRPLAIYQVVGSGHVEPVLIFPRKAPVYHSRLPYAATITDSVTRNTPAFATEEMQKAIATAK